MVSPGENPQEHVPTTARSLPSARRTRPAEYSTFSLGDPDAVLGPGMSPVTGIELADYELGAIRDAVVGTGSPVVLTENRRSAARSSGPGVSRACDMGVKRFGAVGGVRPVPSRSQDRGQCFVGVVQQAEHRVVADYLRICSCCEQAAVKGAGRKGRRSKNGVGLDTTGCTSDTVPSRVRSVRHLAGRTTTAMKYNLGWFACR